jgi:hypothetical protein
LEVEDAAELNLTPFGRLAGRVFQAHVILDCYQVAKYENTRPYIRVAADFPADSLGGSRLLQTRAGGLLTTACLSRANFDS